MNWLISANPKVYDHELAFIERGYIDWRQSNYRFAVGDIVYIYCTAPEKRIRYKCVVEKAYMSIHEIADDRKYRVNFSKTEKHKYMHVVLLKELDHNDLVLEKLLVHGLKAAPQGAK